jgi:hypothetical protein
VKFQLGRWKTPLFAGTSEYPAVLVLVAAVSYGAGMDSENLTGADNQQETASSLFVLNPNWLVGFVDGEGCFCVSVHRSSMMHRGREWQLQPSFQVYQHQDHRDVLDSMVKFFGCGRVRSKGPKSSVLAYTVEALKDLERAVVPFFDAHPPIVKRRDFESFAEVVRIMHRKEHLHHVGFERVVRLAFGMNANGKQRARTIEEVLVGSSETVRGAPSDRWAKIQSDPHGDMGS